MLETLVPQWTLVERRLEDLAPAGFVIALNLRNMFPELYHSGFPEEWTETYTKNRYALFDPMLAWIALNTGAVRWSEISMLGREATATRVMTRAAEIGLRFGAMVVVRDERAANRKSFISVARGDRELTDKEIGEVAELFEAVRAEVFASGGLELRELQVLGALASGQTHEEAAENLGVSKGTIKKRLESARVKLAARNGTHAVAVALHRGLVALSGGQKW
ncbi:autoinducer binding domain-containing protein [Loktanella sp. IMCC34160]|uniref:helix-turn-helix transcriptional regulator n=1 Tax=Loktanella sp. IMCC34160 TaxID=2510646 RepID=UPI0013EBFCC0|nr:autoinducer binding domain-containing protein [Loktanella sp. IMCC34160]